MSNSEPVESILQDSDFQSHAFFSCSLVHTKPYRYCYNLNQGFSTFGPRKNFWRVTAYYYERKYVLQDKPSIEIVSSLSYKRQNTLSFVNMCYKSLRYEIAT